MAKLYRLDTYPHQIEVITRADDGRVLQRLDAGSTAPALVFRVPIETIRLISTVNRLVSEIVINSNPQRFV